LKCNLDGVKPHCPKSCSSCDSCGDSALLFKFPFNSVSDYRSCAWVGK
jgi:hypothetical protein